MHGDGEDPSVDPDPEVVSVGLDPEVVAEEPDLVAATMSSATRRLRANGWMLAPLMRPARTAEDVPHPVARRPRR